MDYLQFSGEASDEEIIEHNCVKLIFPSLRSCKSTLAIGLVKALRQTLADNLFEWRTTNEAWIYRYKVV